MTVPTSLRDSYMEKVKAWGADVSFWKRGNLYEDKHLLESDGVIVILEKTMWGDTLANISSGTRGEINKARLKNKPLYICYTSKTDGELRIYDAQANQIEIQYLSGTANRLQKVIKDHNARMAYVEQSNKLADVSLESFYKSDTRIKNSDVDDLRQEALDKMNKQSNILMRLKTGSLVIRKPEPEKIYKVDKRVLIQML